ncbi:MAG: hypothetical protein LUH05_01665 [Candidatus Gastranaerophilales bacterium]|nr:hypothetical protein [Candidatus Gastranaerophilales bacterium]
MTNDVELSSMRGRFARNFWIRSLVISAIMYNALNVALRIWYKEKNPEFYTDDLKLSDYTLFGNAQDINLIYLSVVIKTVRKDTRE